MLEAEGYTRTEDTPGSIGVRKSVANFDGFLPVLHPTSVVSSNSSAIAKISVLVSWLRNEYVQLSLLSLAHLHIVLLLAG